MTTFKKLFFVLGLLNLANHSEIYAAARAAAAAGARTRSVAEVHALSIVDRFTTTLKTMIDADEPIEKIDRYFKETLTIEAFMDGIKEEVSKLPIDAPLFRSACALRTSKTNKFPPLLIKNSFYNICSIALTGMMAHLKTAYSATPPEKEAHWFAWNACEANLGNMVGDVSGKFAENPFAIVHIFKDGKDAATEPSETASIHDSEGTIRTTSE